MPAAKAATQPNNVSNFQHFAALAEFPSPASVHDPLNSPPLESHVSSSRSLSAIHDPLETAHILSTQPGDVQISSVVTPLADDMPGPDMNLVVGGALAPVHSSLPPRPPTKRPRPGLRLPSFRSLGIANPNPERFGLDGNLTTQQSASTHCGGAGFTPAFPDLKFGRILQDGVPDVDGKPPGGCAIQSPVRQLVNTLTPPAEPEYIDWTSLPSITSAIDSPPPDPDPTIHAEGPEASVVGIVADMPSQASLRQSEVDERPFWIRGAIDVLVQTYRLRPFRNEMLKVISHALPSPSITGHIFSEVIGAVSSSSPGSGSSPTTWINVFHAITGKFNLQDLPRSPPSTPGPAVGADDYFTSKVFDSAVSIADYQQDLSRLPRSPLPVVPPGSVNVSIVERYIPPSTLNEFATMFETNGPSILVDRLIELSPNNGSLLFIYPTRAGANTFMREYLSPILDPILRSFAVTQGFSSDLNRTLSTMDSVDQLPDYEALRHRIESLCARLTQQPSSAERFHGRRPTLTLSYAAKQHVLLNREAWARDWFNKQEKMRIRQTLTKHAQEVQKSARRDMDGERLSASELLQRLLHDIETKPYPNSAEPTHGVEVSAFVITRTS